jgi:hypothetical protein
MRTIGVVLVCLAASISSGCAVFKPLKAGNEPDPWGQVGREARGDQPAEKEWDGLTPYLSSKTAIDIERNLGYR